MGFTLQLMGLVAFLAPGLGACFFDWVIKVPCLALWTFLFVEMGLSWGDLLNGLIFLAAATSGSSFLSVRLFVLQPLLLCSLMLTKIGLFSHTLTLPTRGDHTQHSISQKSVLSSRRAVLPKKTSQCCCKGLLKPLREACRSWQSAL